MPHEGTGQKPEHRKLGSGSARGRWDAAVDDLQVSVVEDLVARSDEDYSLDAREQQLDDAGSALAEFEEAIARDYVTLDKLRTALAEWREADDA